MELPIAAVTRWVILGGRRRPGILISGYTAEVGKKTNPVRTLDRANYLQSQSGSKMRLGHENFNTRHELIGNEHKAYTAHEFLVHCRVDFFSL